MPYDLVENVYKAYWTFIREYISNLNLKMDIDKEEFDKLRTNFNIPNLGKLICPYERHVKKRRKFKYKKDAEYKEN